VLKPHFGGAVCFAVAFAVEVLFVWLFLPHALVINELLVYQIILTAAPVAVFAFIAPKWLSVYTFTKEGIKKSRFGITVIEFKWEEIAEIRFAFFSTKSYLFISPTSLDHYTYKDIKRKKDKIEITAYRDSILAVRRYYDRNIVNYPKDFIVG
jgi:hypothetical protein